MTAPTNHTRQLKTREADYDNFFPEGRMLDDVKGEESDFICFDFNFRIERGEIEKLNVNAYIESNPMVICHNYIMYTYLNKLTVVEKKGDELFFSIETRPMRALFTQTYEIEEGSYESNATPPIKVIKVTIDSDKGEIDVPLVKRDGIFCSRSLLSSNELIGKPSTIIRISIVISRFYFALGHHIDLREDAPLDRHTSDSIDAILSGEKTEKWNWVITVGHGSPQNFYVDARRMERHSCKIALAMRTRTFESDDLLVPPGENRFVLPNMHAKDMRVLIPFFYLGRHELPNCEQFERVAEFLCKICLPPQMFRFMESWHRKLIAHCLNIDESDLKKKARECYRYLAIIHAMKPGMMPLAQRILHAILLDTLPKLIVCTPQGGKKGFCLPPTRTNLTAVIIPNMNQFRKAVTSVEKTYVRVYS